MQFNVFQIDATNNAATLTSDCLVIGVYQDGAAGSAGGIVDQASQGVLTALKEQGDLRGKTGETHWLRNLPGIAAPRVLVIGCGKAGEYTLQRLRDAHSSAARALRNSGVKSAVSFLHELMPGDLDLAACLRHGTEATGAALYRFDRLKSKKNNDNGKFEELRFAVAGPDVPAAEQAIRIGEAIAAGAGLARDLGNLPGNICTPGYLAEQARQLADDYDLQTTVLEEAEMEALGMGALLSVSRGSRQPAKLIVMEYQGGNKAAAPVVLVGKGLTFDAGGISIKSAAGMDEMKYDMCGGASVFGVMKAVAEMKLPINLVGVVPSSENLPDGDANKPGDIVTSMSGQTIEILNTDAEGRLILCDALTYTERFKPAAVIDIATLTGACVVALGGPASGLMTENEDLAQAILAAGQTAWDRAWRLPLWDDYQKLLDSNFADMANVGGREGGAITAACFLARFTKAYPWAHLDVAGTAWLKGKEKGATGRPVGLLTQYLLDRVASEA